MANNLNVQVCQHPPTNLMSWFAHNPVWVEATQSVVNEPTQVVVCLTCKTILVGAAGEHDGERKE